MTYDNRKKPPSNSLEREARREDQRIEAERTMAERKQADEAFWSNFERLKAERLARETKQ
jgi:hypothetical protein